MSGRVSLDTRPLLFLYSTYPDLKARTIYSPVTDLRRLKWLSVLIFCFSQPTVAQVMIMMAPQEVRDDTLRIDVVLGDPGKMLSEKVSSFQFVVQQNNENTAFVGIDKRNTITDKAGWSVRSNPKNSRVGGFSSSLDALDSGGTLTTLLFARLVSCGVTVVSLGLLKLNTGRPQHMPMTPTHTIDFCSAEE